MTRSLSNGTMVAAAACLASACASSPKGIEAAYVSPTKYETFRCDQLATERNAVEYRANALYHRLKKRAHIDMAKMGVGVLVFPPTLLFIKGDSTHAAEFAQLQGDYHALRVNSESRNCDIQFGDIREVAAGDAVSASPPPEAMSDGSETR